MSVKSLPIPGKSRREHVQEASSDGGVVIPLQLRSPHLKWQIQGVIWKVKELKGQEKCLNLEPGAWAL